MLHMSSEGEVCNLALVCVSRTLQTTAARALVTRSVSRNTVRSIPYAISASVPIWSNLPLIELSVQASVFKVPDGGEVHSESSTATSSMAPHALKAAARGH